MSRKRIFNILLKEWQTLLSDVGSLMIVVVLPFIIIGQMLLYVWLAVTFAGDKVLSIAVFQNAIMKLQEAIPGITGLSGVEQFLVLLLNQFTIFLLLIPVMIAMNTVTFSIVDEKISGSLEALLATPVRTWELLTGKALAGAIPSLLMTWLVAGVFLFVITLMGWGHLVGMVLTPVWFLGLFFLTPAITALSFLLGVIGSSRAKDARNAQNIVLVVILPLFGLIAIQVTGITWLNTLATVGLGVLLLVIDFIVLKIAVRLFQRESIVVKWR